MDWHKVLDYAKIITMLKKITLSLVAVMSSVTLTSCAQILDADLSLDSIVKDAKHSSSKGINTEDAAKALKNVEYLKVSDTPYTGKYDRVAQFGDAWTDNNDAPMGHNGCDTRNDILKRDLTDIEYKDKKNCVVLTGTLEKDPYTGRTIDFIRGTETSSAIQIDHIIPLKNAWVSGAWKWTQEERIAFANHPDNLIASDGPSNMSKSDKTADKWLVPDNPDYRCTYAAQQVNLKGAFNLTVTTAERDALKAQLQKCQ